MKRLVLTAMLICSACRRDGVHSLPSSANAPSVLDFGAVQVGDHKTQTLSITNDSLYPFDFTGGQVAAPFAVVSGPMTIPSSGSGTVQVTFTPTSSQSYDQSLKLLLSATDTPELAVKLTGSGVVQVPATCQSTCGPGHECCSDECVDTQTDPKHCGGCSACGNTQTCVAGVCTNPVVNPPSGSCDDLTAPCPGAQKCCDHACKDVGASGLCPCASNGGSTLFGSGSIIIPMDACYQRGIDITTTPSYCTTNAKTTSDDAPLKAYGLVFFLLRHQVTVYMAINPAKTAIDGVDLTLSSFLSRTIPVQRYDWATGKAVSMPDPNSIQIAYRGAPFLIDSSQHDRVMQLLATDPDFAQFRSAANITVHIANRDFSTAVAKSISAVPSRIALLVPANDNNSNSDILVRYLTSAGLNFPGAGGTPAAPGIIYDQLQESDFLPDYDHSNLKAKGYRLLWSPHWDGGTANTAAQLQTIGDYVGAGGDLFAECAAIGTLEGFTGGGRGSNNQPGSTGTRFMTNSGMTGNVLGGGGGGGYTGPFTFGGLASPFAQRGDFPFAGFTGAISDYHPGSGSSYYTNVVRYITGNDTFNGSSDLFTSVDLHAQGKGTVVYLSGHDYSYGGREAGSVGLTAGSRLVLNTIFSLGNNDICQR